MSNMRIVVEKRGVQADIAVVQVYGSLDTVAAYTFQEKMHTLIQAGIHKIVLDLQSLEYISSAGIGVFPGMSTELQCYDGQIIFARVPEKILKLFELIGLITLFIFKDTVDQAIKEFEAHE